VSLPSACDPAMDGPPSIFTLLAKGFVQGTQEFVSRLQNSVINSVVTSATILHSSTFPTWSFHPQKSVLGLFKGCTQVCSEVTTSFATLPFTSVTNHQVCAQVASTMGQFFKPSPTCAQNISQQVHPPHHYSNYSSDEGTIFL
jgi:hypothetical protein